MPWRLSILSYKMAFLVNFVSVFEKGTLFRMTYICIEKDKNLVREKSL